MSLTELGWVISFYTSHAVKINHLNHLWKVLSHHSGHKIEIVDPKILGIFNDSCKINFNLLWFVLVHSCCGKNVSGTIKKNYGLIS